MVSGLNASGLQFLNNVDSLQNRLTNVQNQLSSGLQVNTAADAPDQVSEILQLHANIQQNQKVQDNLNSVQGETNTADQNLTAAITLMDQAQTLATEGLGIDQNAQTRATLSSQVGTVLQQMVSISQTQVDGRYIFSGDADQSPSYQYDPNSPSGVDRLQVSTSTREVADTNGNRFPVALSANQIFDARDASDAPTSGNVFAALNSLRVALANNDTSGIQSGESALRDASSYLNQQQSFYGNVENRVSAALTAASNAGVAYQTDLSNREDANSAQDIVQMQQYMTNLQAAMSAEAKMPTQTLFSVLQ